MNTKLAFMYRRRPTATLSLTSLATIASSNCSCFLPWEISKITRILKLFNS